MQKLRCSVVLAIAIYPVTHTFAAQFIPLSDLVPGTLVSGMQDVSNDGSTVVGSYSFDGVTGRAFRWRLATGLVELLRPNLEPINGGAIAVSADGSKVLGVDADFGPFLWTEGAGTDYLNIFPTDVHQVTDMSADGSVIVGEVRRESPQGSYNEAFRWSAADGVTIIPAIPESNGGHTSGPKVSDDGATIVGNHTFYHPDHTFDAEYAFRWTETSGTVSLDVPNGATSSFAVDITADGSVFLGSARMASGGNNTFLQRSNGIHSFGPLPDAMGGGMDYFASDITPDGHLVVGSAVVPNREPFVWDEVRGFRSLRTILDAAAGTPLTGWDDDLGPAYAMSADGTVIVGAGAPDGDTLDQVWVMLFERREIDPPQGDFNRDGNVDAADYIVWSKQVGELVAECSGADANCDGFVSNGDVEPWTRYFGESVNMGEGADTAGAFRVNIPEPTSLTLCLLVAASMFSMQRVRRLPRRSLR